MFFKYLLYLFLSYVIFRFVFGRLFGAPAKTKVFHFETHHHHYKEKEQKKPEGTITVDTKNAEKPQDKRNLGEYVDYEEIK